MQNLRLVFGCEWCTVWTVQLSQRASFLGCTAHGYKGVFAYTGGNKLLEQGSTATYWYRAHKWPKNFLNIGTTTVNGCSTNRHKASKSNWINYRKNEFLRFPPHRTKTSHFCAPFHRKVNGYNIYIEWNSVDRHYAIIACCCYDCLPAAMASHNNKRITSPAAAGLLQRQPNHFPFT